jgi:hypothetical protein
MEGVECQFLKWCEKSKVRWLNPVIEGSTAPTNRTIAYSDVVQISVHFKSNAAAMAGALIGLLHSLTAFRLARVCLVRWSDQRRRVF